MKYWYKFLSGTLGSILLCAHFILFFYVVKKSANKCEHGYDKNKDCLL